MKWMILDFETMGTDSLECAAVDISAMVIDTARFLSQPYTLRDVTLARRFKLSVRDQVENYGFTVEEDTVKFWMAQSPEVRAKIKPKADDLTVVQFVEQFHDFLIESPKIDHWFTRGNSFDPVILYRLFKAVGKTAHLNEYLKFWRCRDLRTHIDAKLDFPKINGFVPVANEEFFNKVFQQHDSSWDILADVLRLQAITRAENDLEMIEK